MGVTVVGVDGNVAVTTRAMTRPLICAVSEKYNNFLLYSDESAVRLAPLYAKIQHLYNNINSSSSHKLL
jgi:hypothetical protein